MLYLVSVTNIHKITRKNEHLIEKSLSCEQKDTQKGYIDLSLFDFSEKADCVCLFSVVVGQKERLFGGTQIKGFRINIH